MRVALILLVVALAGCAKKQTAQPAATPAAAPAPEATKAADETNDNAGGEPVQSDPCDGGESK